METEISFVTPEQLAEELETLKPKFSPEHWAVVKEAWNKATDDTKILCHQHIEDFYYEGFVGTLGLSSEVITLNFLESMNEDFALTESRFSPEHWAVVKEAWNKAPLKVKRRASDILATDDLEEFVAYIGCKAVPLRDNE